MVHPTRVLPRTSVSSPSEWQVAVRNNTPMSESGWVCVEADGYMEHDSDNDTDAAGVLLPLPVYGSCRICLKGASLKCSRCFSIFYCSSVCQKTHWKLSHKQACQKCPRPFYKMNTDLQIIHTEALRPHWMQGHEFITIKATDQLDGGGGSLLDICEQVLEPADDIFDIPGFGMDQIDISWAMTNSKDPISQAIQRKFGWTSGSYAVDFMEGYQYTEDKMVYMLLFDDCFLNPHQSPGLETSYYGTSCFPQYGKEGKHVRGNIVIFKQIVMSKYWAEQPRVDPLSKLIQQTDESLLRFTYGLAPICKAEVAHILLERRKMIDQGLHSRRTWRQKIRQAEREIEELKQEGSASFSL